MESDGVSLGDSSLETLDDFVPYREAIPPADGRTLGSREPRHGDRALKLVRASHMTLPWRTLLYIQHEATSLNGQMHMHMLGELGTAELS